MTTKKFNKICDGCICELLNDPDIIISQNIFHSNICAFHREYCENEANFEEKKLYEDTGRNFFIDLVEYNIIKEKIRNETIMFLMKFLKDYFQST